MKRIILLGFIIIVICVLVGYKVDNDVKPITETQEFTDAGNIITTLTVKGIYCGNCVNAITKALSSLDGIISVLVDIKAGKVTIVHEPEIAVDVIKDIITYEANFTVEKG